MLTIKLLINFYFFSKIRFTNKLYFEMKINLIDKWIDKKKIKLFSIELVFNIYRRKNLIVKIVEQGLTSLLFLMWTSIELLFPNKTNSNK